MNKTKISEFQRNYIPVRSRSDTDDVPVFNFDINTASAEADYLLRSGSAEKKFSLNEFIGDIRFITTGSQIAPDLEKFVTSIFGPLSIYRVSKDDIHGFSSQKSSFSVVVAVFDDITRAKRVLRQIKRFLDNKLCYAIMTESTPKTRADLMRFAFDDVFDLRTKPAEMIARMEAHWNRQIQYNSALKGDESFQIFCSENIEGRVYITQMEILHKLWENMGKVVKYNDLASYDFHSNEFRIKSLKVRVHNLRKRLKYHDICSVRNVGYMLVKRSG